MGKRKIVISGTGCALADFLYSNIRFDNPSFRKFLSATAGDGGLSPGRLVFTEELEKFTGVDYPRILNEITGNSLPDTFNLGGPALVSLINASQLLPVVEFEVKFYGNLGHDVIADKILKLVTDTPLDITNYRKRSILPSPSTDVFSDPTYAGGNGERTFVNNIGAAREFNPAMLDEDFFRSSIICFGGTALVPAIHDNLSDLLKRAKKNGGITVVNTVFDFRNEKKNPEKPWPLVSDEADYRLIDILVADREEANRLSGQSNESDAARFFIEKKVSSIFITNGSNEITVYSDGKLFCRSDLNTFPVSEMITSEFRSKGDTTGCGDNFAGGIITSVAMQLKSNKGPFDIISALAWAVASGGLTCSYKGGTYYEKYNGEKRERTENIKDCYLKQIARI